MFLPLFKACCNFDADSTSSWKQRRLMFLKAMRDDLETRLAAINAAIDSIERQNRQEEG